MNEELSQEEITTEQVKKLPNPTGKGGFGDNPQNINPGGRLSNSMKSYLARKMAGMSDKQKEKFLKEHKVTGKDQIEFGEGKAKQDIGIPEEVTIKILRLDA